MEIIKILLFVLTSFFGKENGQIAADKTHITIDTTNRTMTIVHEGLFSVIQSEADSIAVVKNWKDIQQNLVWSEELSALSSKELVLSTPNDGYTATITLRFNKEEDLRPFGIWYNSEESHFALNNLPRQNLTTQDGSVDGLYWIFKAQKTIEFTLEPFLDLPEKHQKKKRSLKTLLRE